MSRRLQKKNDPCVICGGFDDEDLILLCDNCDKAIHASCVYPKFKGPLLGDWFCHTCILCFEKKKSSKNDE